MSKVILRSAAAAAMMAVIMVTGSCATGSAGGGAGSGGSGSDLPAWYLDPDSVYPDEQYLTAVGSGSSRREAEQQAMSGLAQIFQVDISVDATTQERYKQIMTAQGTVEESDVELAQTMNVRAAQSLLNVQTGEAAVDDNGRTHVIAYIERMPTGRLYADLVADNDEQISRFIQAAEGSEDILREFAYLNAAVVVAQSNEVLLSQLRIISPSMHSLASISYNLDDLLEKRADTTEQIRISVQLDGDANDRVSGIVREALGEHRLPVSTENPVLILQGRVNIEPVAMNPDFETVRWTLNIDVERAEGASLFTYDNQGRPSGATTEQATAFAYQDIEEAVEQEFIAGFQRYFDELVLGEQD